MITLYGLLAIAAFVFFVALPLVWWEERRRRRKAEKLFAARQSLSELEFYEKYYQAQNIPLSVVSTVKKILGYELNVDVSKLRPEDKFSKIGFQWVDDYYFQYSEVYYSLNDEFGIKIHEDEIAQVDSFDELLNLVWRTVQQNANL